MGGAERDVFISYGRADADWVRTLAENLYQSGLELFFDEWDIAPGDVLVHKLDDGILASRSGILVVSPTALTRPYVQAEYAALMGRAIERGQRLIPVLLKDAEMPPLLASRIWIDFRNADGSDYLARVGELVRALKGERGGPPSRTGELSLPPGSGFKAVGTLSCGLSIRPGRTTLSGDGVEVAGLPPRADFDFDELQWKLKRARASWGPLRDAGGTAAGRDELGSVLQDMGGKLADAFLPHEVASRLASAVAEAERLNGTLQLALDIADPFADLPWETLRLPQTGALALHPRVELYRRIDTGGSTPAVAIPGPLRILVAIGSPEAQNARGELLDMEAELRTILDAIDAPQRAGKAFVHILEQGSIKAIHTALAARRYHVLHISCHAAPGALILEDANGKEDAVTAKRLCDEAIPAERAAPLVVLAGCSTGQDVAAVHGSGDGRLPGLARTLVARGVPQVIAMQAPVGDRYATDLMGSVYGALAQWEEPRPLAALGHARRHVEDERLADKSALQPPPEWATPAFFCAASPLRLYDAGARFEDLKKAPEPVFDRGVVVRRIGELVGRRREQRLILRALRDADGAGVLLQGIGGVGKSTLAAQILHRLADDDGFLLFSLKGETDPDRVLGAIGLRLFSIGIEQAWDERHPLRQLSGILREPKYPWHDRFEFLAQNLLAQVPVAFLFDSFEDNLPKENLKDGAPAEELAALLARWVQAPLKSRLVFTCRYPFALPEDAHERLKAFHLGPLSWAETRKLFWHLDGLKAPSVEDQRRAYEHVGGHPRALEYLDAILRDGKAHFPDVQSCLRQQLKDNGIADPARWCADTAGGLNAALAETVTLAAADILLDKLLEQLQNEPLARRLLIDTSVYRIPVDDIGLTWPVGTPVTRPENPGVRTEVVFDFINPIKPPSDSSSFTPAALGLLNGELQTFGRYTNEAMSAPIHAPTGFEQAKQLLQDFSLLSPFRVEDDAQERFLVHRWTAASLAKRFTNEVRQAHHSAAEYYRWQLEKLPLNSLSRILSALELRYHYRAEGDLNSAILVTTSICDQLETWGAGEWVERMINETTPWISDHPKDVANFRQVKAQRALAQGNHEKALAEYHDIAALFEQSGDKGGVAAAYYNIASIEADRGNNDVALLWGEKSLSRFKAVGDKARVASSYHQLSSLAYRRGDYDTALAQSREAAAAFEQLRDAANAAGAYFSIGLVATRRGDDEAASYWFQKSLKVFEVFGNIANMGKCYREFGAIAQRRSDNNEALSWYRKSLEIAQRIGNHRGMAESYMSIGLIAQERGDYEGALSWYDRALKIYKDAGYRQDEGKCYIFLGMVKERLQEDKAAISYYRQSLAIAEATGDLQGVVNSLWNIIPLYSKLHWENPWNALSNSEIAYNLGALLVERGMFEDAINAYRRATDLGNSLAPRNLGIVLAQQNRTEEAEKAFREGINHGDSGAAANLGILLMQNGRLEEAETAYKIGMDLGSGAAANNLGFFLEKRLRCGPALLSLLPNPRQSRRRVNECQFETCAPLRQCVRVHRVEKRERQRLGRYRDQCLRDRLSQPLRIGSAPEASYRD